ncbi:hypothetical protein F2Q68_00028214 [Brassica cretica]|uniref:Uncharacterized protein n=2 Tax=Brassica cretica TaxID=69181 RepID=A0ABQ7DV95_BRACR|nr:hypothetical protein F2Q68_00028214 [Brassica cretica]KAF3581777.1 hypothetical protein DY000_02035734 [Brassica cretica]
MIFLFAFLALVAPIPGASTPSPPNPSDSTPSGSMTPRDSELLDNSTLPIQSNTSPSSPAHPTQPGQESNPIPSPYFRHPYTLSPVTQRQNNASSSAHPYTLSQRPPQSTSTRVPWYHDNELYAVERAAHGIPPNEFHLLDRLSLCVIQYAFAWGINYATERPNLNTSIYIQAFLNHGALSLFLLANAVFPRTRPVLAFILDRLSFLLIVISAYLASLPTLLSLCS